MRSKSSLIFATQKAGSKPSRISFRRWEKLKRFSSMRRSVTWCDAAIAWRGRRRLYRKASGRRGGSSTNLTKLAGRDFEAQADGQGRMSGARAYWAAAVDVPGGGEAAGRFERIRDSTRLMTLGSHSISMCGFSKARASQE